MKKTVVCEATMSTISANATDSFIALPEPKKFEEDFYQVPVYEVNNDGELKLVKVVTQRFGPALKEAQRLSGCANPVFKVIGRISESDAEYVAENKRECLENVAKGFTKKGKVRKPAIMGTNALMQNCIIYMDENIIDAVRQYSDAGAIHTELETICKELGYDGLLCVYTKKLTDKLTPHFEALTPSCKTTVKGQFVVFEPDGSIREVDEWLVDEFDGQAIFEITDTVRKEMGLSRKEEKELMEMLRHFKGGTGRAPRQKMSIVTGVKIHEILHAMGVHTIGGKNIEEIAIFGDISVFKAAIGRNFNSWDHYADNFVLYKHAFGVLLENHGLKKGNLPSQQLNCVVDGERRFIDEGAAEEVKYLKEAQEEETAKARYLPKVLSEIKGFFGTWLGHEIANSQYKRERDQALAGTTHANSYCAQICTDVFAYCEWIAYLEGVRKEAPKGVLKADTLFTPELSDEECGEIVFSRNPIVALYGLKVMKAINALPEEYAKYLTENFRLIMVPMGGVKLVLRADCDGDKGRITTAQWFVNLVKSAQAKATKKIAVWDSFGTPYKDVLTQDAVEHFAANAYTQATLGMNCYYATICYQQKLITDTRMQLVADYAINKGTDTKQGADSTKFFGASGRLWKKFTDAAENAKITKSHAAAMRLKGKNPAAKRILADYTDCPTDVISKAVCEQTPCELPKAKEILSPRHILFGQKPVHINGLTEFGSRSQNYEDQGIFVRLARLHQSEYKELIGEENNIRDAKDFNRMKKQAAREELAKWAFKNGYTFEEMYNSIATDVFINWRRVLQQWPEKLEFLMVLGRFFITIFSEEMIEAYNENTDSNVQKEEVLSLYEVDEDDADGLDS